MKLDVQSLSVTLGENHILKDASFSIDSGEFVGIIGPNGSGKSNIVDAIRWVLGEQSMKSLRGQKSQDIIFSGTQIRRSLGFAEVALYIDNKSRKLKIEYDEVVVKIKDNGKDDHCKKGPEYSPQNSYNGLFITDRNITQGQN